MERTPYAYSIACVCKAYVVGQLPHCNLTKTRVRLHRISLRRSGATTSSRSCGRRRRLGSARRPRHCAPCAPQRLLHVANALRPRSATELDLMPRIPCTWTVRMRQTPPAIVVSTQPAMQHHLRAWQPLLLPAASSCATAKGKELGRGMWLLARFLPSNVILQARSLIGTNQTHQHAMRSVAQKVEAAQLLEAAPAPMRLCACVADFAR